MSDTPEIETPDSAGREELVDQLLAKLRRQLLAAARFDVSETFDWDQRWPFEERSPVLRSTTVRFEISHRWAPQIRTDPVHVSDEDLPKHLKLHVE